MYIFNSNRVQGSENSKYWNGTEVERPVRYKGAEHLGVSNSIRLNDLN